MSHRETAEPGDTRPRALGQTAYFVPQTDEVSSPPLVARTSPIAGLDNLVERGQAGKDISAFVVYVCESFSDRVCDRSSWLVVPSCRNAVGSLDSDSHVVRDCLQIRGLLAQTH